MVGLLLLTQVVPRFLLLFARLFRPGWTFTFLVIFGVSAVKPVQILDGSGYQIGFLGTVVAISGKSWSDPSTDFEVEGHAV